MRSIFKLAIKMILFPKRTWHEILHKRIVGIFILKYIAVLALIGPVLSFFSMYVIEGLEIKKVATYSIVTYTFDIASVYIFAIFIKIVDDSINYKTALKISAFGSTAIWLSDIVDIYQYLRPLSILGFLYSLYLIYMGLKLTLKKDIKYIAVLLIIFSILYGLNSLVAETIVQNPVIKEVII